MFAFSLHYTYICWNSGVHHTKFLLITARCPWVLTVTWLSETLHRLLVRRAHIAYQQSHGVMKFKIFVDDWLVINVIYLVCLIYEREWRRLLNIYCIFTIEFLWPRQKTRTFALKDTKFTMLVDPLWLSLIHIWRCRRYAVCRSRWSPYH